MSPKYYTPAHFLWKDARGQIRSSIKPANKNMSKKEKIKVCFNFEETKKSKNRIEIICDLSR